MLTAAEDQRVRGVLLVDAGVPGYFTRELLDQTLAAYRPQYAEVEERLPELARTLIPLLEAYPRTARSLELGTIPPSLPIICIVAEHPGELTEENNDLWLEAQERFARASPSRRLVVATDSSHTVMQDRPDLIQTCLAELVSTVTAVRTG